MSPAGGTSGLPASGCGSAATPSTVGSGPIAPAASTPSCPGPATPIPARRRRCSPRPRRCERRSRDAPPSRSPGSSPRTGGGRPRPAPSSATSCGWSSRGEARRARRPSAASRPRAETTCGPATPSTERWWAAARPTSSPSSTTTRERSSAIAGVTARTRSAWRRRCGEGSHHAVCHAVSTSTTARRWSLTSSPGRAPVSASSSCTPPSGALSYPANC